MVSKEPETSTEEETSNDEDPDWGVGLFADYTCRVGVVSSDPRRDGVCNIVGAAIQKVSINALLIKTSER